MSDPMPFSSLTLVNPPVTFPLPSSASEVSFIPMQDVSDSGCWMNHQSKRLKEIGAGYTTFQEGDVLFAKITPCMENGKGTHAVGLANGVGFGSTEFHVLRAKPGVFDRYIYHWCNSRDLRHAAEVQMTGSAGQKRVPADFFSRYEVTSIDIDDQHTISTILDTIDNAIQQTEVMIAKLKLIKTGLLHDLLTFGLDENGELRDPIRHPEQFKDSPLGRIPKGWKVDVIGSLIKDLLAGVSVNAWDKPAGAHEVGVLKTSAVNAGRFYPEENKTVISRDIRRVACPVTTETIIISRMNTPTLVGESGYVDQGVPDLYLPDRLWKTMMRSDKDSCVKWLSYVLNWQPIRQKIRDGATGTSGSMKNIAKGTLLSIQLAIPNYMDQLNIAEILEDYDSVVNQEIAQLGKLKHAKQGLMRDLLTGTVSVKDITV